MKCDVLLLKLCCQGRRLLVLRSPSHAVRHGLGQGMVWWCLGVMHRYGCVVRSLLLLLLLLLLSG